MGSTRLSFTTTGAGAAAGAGDAVDADVGAAGGGAHRVQQRRVLAPRVPVRRVPDLDPVARCIRVSDQRRELLYFFGSRVSVCLLVIVHWGGLMCRVWKGGEEGG